MEIEPQDFINDLYSRLMEEGYKIHEIDQMDMRQFMEVLAHRYKDAKKPKAQYIDQLPCFG